MPLDSYRGIADNDDAIVPHSEILRRYGPHAQLRPEWRRRESIGMAFFIMAVAIFFFRPTGLPFIHFDLFGKSLGFLPPLIVFICVVASPILWLASKPEKSKIPMHLPAQSGLLDPLAKNEKGSPIAAVGTFYEGNVEERGNPFGPQFWLSKDKKCQHSAYIGTTGAGKTSALLGVFANALIQSSGIFGIDGKSDSKFFRQFIALTRLFNVQYNLRLVNFQNVDPDIAESFGSNTFNMFAMAPADDMYNLVSSLKTEMSKENKTFSDRGDAVAQSVVNMLTYARDRLGVMLNPADLRDHIMDLDNNFRLSVGKVRGLEDDRIPNDPAFRMHAESMLAYLKVFMPPKDIAEYLVHGIRIFPQKDAEMFARSSARNGGPAPRPEAVKAKFPWLWSDGGHKELFDEICIALGKESGGGGGGMFGGGGTPVPDPAAKTELLKQHGFNTMSFGKAMNTVTSGYARIFGDSLGDVTIEDVVKNRRIVMVMLPSMGKSSSEVMSLSKVMVSNIRGMASRALGSKVYGMMDELAKMQLTSANSPFILAFDEAGAYMQEGMDEINKQVRSLNFATIMGFQDLPGLERHDAAVAKSALGSANYIYFMRIQDPTSTGKTASEFAGETYAAVANSFVNENSIFSGKRSIDGENISLQRMAKLTFQDLQAQPPGGAHLIAEGKVFRIRTFYTEPLSCVDQKRTHVSIRRLAGWEPVKPEFIVFEDQEPSYLALAKTGIQEGQDTQASQASLPDQPTQGVSDTSAQSKSVFDRFQGGYATPSDGSASTLAPGEDAFAAAMRQAKMALPGSTAPTTAPLNDLGNDDEPTFQVNFDEGDAFPPLPDDVETQVATEEGADERHLKFLNSLQVSADARIRQAANYPAHIAQLVSYDPEADAFQDFLHLINTLNGTYKEMGSHFHNETMLLGAFTLAGIRSQKRREAGALPPFVPQEWITNPEDGVSGNSLGTSMERIMGPDNPMVNDDGLIEGMLAPDEGFWTPDVLDKADLDASVYNTLFKGGARSFNPNDLDDDTNDSFPEIDDDLDL